MRLYADLEREYGFWTTFRALVGDDSAKPLTDNKIAQKLKEYGFPTTLARVTSLRQKYAIPSSHKRGK